MKPSRNVRRAVAFVRGLNCTCAECIEEHLPSLLTAAEREAFEAGAKAMRETCYEHVKSWGFADGEVMVDTLVCKVVTYDDWRRDEDT